MKLCAQLYSLRDFCQTPEDTEKTFGIVKGIGYEAVQCSGLGPIAPEKIREISEKYGLPVVCTHSPFDRIINDTDALIKEHRVYGCDVIGLGAMPGEYRGSLENLNRFTEVLRKPVSKILDAGLHFAYHNHNFEFAKLPDSERTAYDILLDECKDWHFILDTYWVEYAGYSAVEYIKKVGGNRLPNIHYKDMANNEKRSICACGDGVLDFGKITDACNEIGVKNVLVEQDNANDFTDAFEQMERSYSHLRKFI